MQTAENNIQVLVNEGVLWEFDTKKYVWEKRDFFKLYPHIQEGVRGGFKCKNNYTWLFKGEIFMGKSEIQTKIPEIQTKITGIQAKNLIYIFE
jgi:hypothetical protein